MTINHIAQSQFFFSSNFLSLSSGSENFDLMKMVKQPPPTNPHIHLPTTRSTVWTQELNTGSLVFVLHYKDIKPWRFLKFGLLEVWTMFIYKIPVCMTLYTGREPACTHKAPVVYSRQQPLGFGFYKLNYQIFNGNKL